MSSTTPVNAANSPRKAEEEKASGTGSGSSGSASGGGEGPAPGPAAAGGAGSGATPSWSAEFRKRRGAFESVSEGEEGGGGLYEYAPASAEQSARERRWVEGFLGTVGGCGMVKCDCL